MKTKHKLLLVLVMLVSGLFTYLSAFCGLLAIGHPGLAHWGLPLAVAANLWCFRRICDESRREYGWTIRPYDEARDRRQVLLVNIMAAARMWRRAEFTCTSGRSDLAQAVDAFEFHERSISAPPTPDPLAFDTPVDMSHAYPRVSVRVEVMSADRLQELIERESCGL